MLAISFATLLRISSRVTSRDPADSRIDESKVSHNSTSRGDISHSLHKHEYFSMTDIRDLTFAQPSEVAPLSPS